MAGKTRQSLKFVPAKENEIQIDLDLPWFRFGQVKIRPSKSGNVHITIKNWQFRKLSISQRIILAAALGDDPIRARLNMRRARLGDPYPVLFLEERK